MKYDTAVIRGANLFACVYFLWAELPRCSSIFYSHRVLVKNEHLQGTISNTWGGGMIEFLLHFEFLDRDDSSITYIYVIDEAYCINHLTGTYVIKLSIKLFFWVWSWHFQNRIYWYWPKKYYLHTTWNHPWNILVVMKELHSL